MNERLGAIEQFPDGMELEECVRRADEFIGRNGACLLVMDIIGARKFPDWKKRYDDYAQLLGELNTVFGEHLPENRLTSLERVEKGFNMILSDGATGAIDDSSIIEPIMRYVEGHPTQLPLRYAVAEDGFDRVGIRIIK